LKEIVFSFFIWVFSETTNILLLRLMMNNIFEGLKMTFLHNKTERERQGPSRNLISSFFKTFLRTQWGNKRAHKAFFVVVEKVKE